MSKLLKSSLYYLSILLLSCLVSGCGGDGGGGDDTSGTALSADALNSDSAFDVSGTWRLELAPHSEPQPDEQEAQAVTLHEVVMSQNGAVVEGSLDVFTLQGIISGDTIEFYVTAEADEGSMDPVSHFTVNMLDQDTMVGSGLIIEPDSKGPESTGFFEITGVRTGDAPMSKVSFNDIYREVCKTVGNVGSFVAGLLTKKAFRPMGGCWAQKNGNGFYMFGSTGPGSMFPVWTQTVYFPFGFAACSVRTYHFDIRLGDRVKSYNELLKAVRGVGPFLEVLGYKGMSLFTDHVSDFMDKHGHFAVSLGYSTRSHNVSVYVNVSKNSSSAANHPMIKKIVRGLNKIGLGLSEIEVFSGSKISDTWRLRRGPVAACATPVYFIYLFGTNEVKYD